MWKSFHSLLDNRLEIVHCHKSCRSSLPSDYLNRQAHTNRPRPFEWTMLLMFIFLSFLRFNNTVDRDVPPRKFHFANLLISTLLCSAAHIMPLGPAAVIWAAPFETTVSASINILNSQRCSSWRDPGEFRTIERSYDAMCNIYIDRSALINKILVEKIEFWSDEMYRRRNVGQVHYRCCIKHLTAPKYEPPKIVCGRCRHQPPSDPVSWTKMKISQMATHEKRNFSFFLSFPLAPSPLVIGRDQ